MKRNLHNDEGGQILIMTALCLIVLCGFVSFAVDIGLLYHSKTKLQKVADAAAIAGAMEIKSGNWQTAACDNATANDSTLSCASGVTVTKGTPFHPNAVTVYATKDETLFLAKVFGVSSKKVGATAVAGLVNSGGACIYALNPPSKGGGGGAGITINGAGHGAGHATFGIYMPNCGVYDNATLDLNAASKTLITASSVGANSLKGNGESSPPAIAPTPPVSDPLAGYWSPDPQTLCSSPLNDPKLTSGPPINPGCYKALTLSGTAKMNPGLYVVQGNVNVNLTGNGVSDATWPTTGGATGVTMYVDATHGGSLSCSQCQFTGNFNSPAIGSGFTGTCSSSGCTGLVLWDTELASKQQHPIDLGTDSLSGIVYMPTADVVLGGSSVTTLNADLVCGSLTFNGDVVMNSFAIGSGGTSPFASAALVE